MGLSFPFPRLLYKSTLSYEIGDEIKMPDERSHFCFSVYRSVFFFVRLLGCKERDCGGKKAVRKNVQQSGHDNGKKKIVKELFWESYTGKTRTT